MMESTNLPPANNHDKTNGKNNKDSSEQQRFTDANRKRKESDHHTVGGF